MKTKKTIVIILSLVIGFAIGLLTGTIIYNPGMNLIDAAGTIGRVDQYRNVRITEADIELRNELLSDEEMLEAYRSYLAFEYSANLRMVEDLNAALQAGRDIPEFSSKNAHTLDRMDRYAGFLENARLTILDAMSALNDLSGQSRVAVRSLLNNAGNAIVRSHNLSSPVFDFMLSVDSFMKQNPDGDFGQLALAHDQLLANLMMINIINKNLPVLEYLIEKSAISEDRELAQFDSEMLRAKVLEDADNLGLWILDSEKLNLIVYDTERLSILFDKEVLSGIVFFDNEQLRGIAGLDSERLSAIDFFDTEKLSMIILDTEKLNRVVLDTEKLNFVLKGSEQLNLWNMQQLGLFY